MVRRGADRVDRAWHGRQAGAGIGDHGGAGEVEVGVTAVVVEEIGPELGVIQVRREPAQRHAELAAVTGILGFGTRHIGIIDAAALSAGACHLQA
ncbi:hypothetical protein D3C73_1334390 [compost metagenome]